MPSLMPSLFKYFVTIGAILFVGLIGLNAVMEPGGPGLRVVQDSPKAKLVRHDPRASLVERLREEEAAQRASGKAEASPVQAAAPKVSPVPAVAPMPPAVTQAAAVAQPQPAKQAALEPVAPAKASAPVAEHQSAPAALTGVATDDEAARATRVAQEKAAAEKPRKKRVVRERTRARPFDETPAARQQDQYYYSQRAPTYAYAPPPRSVFGPFNQQAQSGWFGGGWGRGW